MLNSALGTLWLAVSVATAGETGEITVNAEGGARVFLDGEDTGRRAPTTLKNVPSGRHEVMVTLDCARGVRAVDVAADATPIVSIPLEPGHGTVEVSTWPAGAAVMIDDWAVGTAPLTAELPCGDYTVELELEAHQSMTVDVEVLPFETVSVTRALEPVSFGTLVISVEPLDAQVSLDDEVIGQGPVTLDDIPSGPHLLEVSSPDDGADLRRVYVVADEVTRVDVVLDGTVVDHTLNSPEPSAEMESGNGAGVGRTVAAVAETIAPLGKIKVDTGGSYNVWLPAPIPDTNFDTQLFATAYFDAEATIFNQVVLERVRVETSVGSRPPPGAVGLAPNMVNALILDNIIGFYLPQLNNVEIPCIIRTSKNPDCAFYAEKAGPAFRADVKRYRANLTLSENKFVLFDDANPFAEIADIEREAGSNFDIDTRFVQLVGGLGFSTDDAYVKSSGLVGFAFLEFHKPWSLAYLSGSEGTDGGLMMFSRFRAYGIGQQYRRESIGRAGLVLDTEIFAGLGSVRLADGVDLLEVLAENDLALMALYGGAEVGFHLGLTKGEQRGLHLNALLGGDFDWFFAYSSEGEGDLLSEENETLTFDVRSHGTIELRAMF